VRKRTGASDSDHTCDFFVSGWMQSDATVGSSIAATSSAVAADFQTAHDNVEMAIPLDLAFQAVKQIALELGNASASKASHMDVIALWASLVKVLLPLQMHQIEFVN
jgi:mannose/fructose/N-acetylgalactosamine-specific phosphotransferase system component IIC